MRLPPMIEPREVRLAGLLLAALVAIAAIVNVPWAVTMIRSRLQAPKLPMTMLLFARKGDQVPTEYPSRTPHPKPWPAPDTWEEHEAFGYRLIRANSDTANSNRDRFSMELQWAGWPLPVIEIKQMWWNWNDPALKGPENDPRPSLMLGGLLLNPLILGGSAWLALALPWLIFTMIRRSSRWRNRRCMACGYPVGTSPTCTECGASLKTESRKHKAQM